MSVRQPLLSAIFASLASLAAMAPAPAAPAAAEDPVALAEQGLKRWAELRLKDGAHYRYTARRSFMLGVQTTTIEVKDHKVISRTYEEIRESHDPPNPGAPPTRQVAASWTEEGDEIGANGNGAPPLTLDEIYAGATAIAKQLDGPDRRGYAKLDDQGLIIQLFYVDTRIADDAPINGIFITEIELLGDAGE